MNLTKLQWTLIASLLIPACGGGADKPAAEPKKAAMPTPAKAPVAAPQPEADPPAEEPAAEPPATPEGAPEGAPPAGGADDEEELPDEDEEG
ncbi:MAG: hypothetical protein R3A51_19865 [Nannocystaceae bacterium]